MKRCPRLYLASDMEQESQKFAEEASKGFKVVWTLIHRHFRWQARILGRDQAFQAGVIGLWKASLKFDSSRGKWASYLRAWIRAELNDAASRESVIHIPRNAWITGVRVKCKTKDPQAFDTLPDDAEDSLEDFSDFSALRSDLKSLQSLISKQEVQRKQRLRDMRQKKKKRDEAKNWRQCV